MAKARKDQRGRALHKGESQRKDGRYVYTYTDPFGKRHFVYAKDIVELRKKEDELKKAQLDGLDVYSAGNADLNFVFDRYIATKKELASSTYANYIYMYDRYVRDGFGKKKVSDIKYSDVVYFYEHLLNEHNIQVNTLDNIHTVLHPSFQLAVRDNIIRSNPSDGVMAIFKRRNRSVKTPRHALTAEQQKAFLEFVRENPVYYRWAPMLTVLFGTGGRIGEIIGLRWDDIDYDKNLISINHSVSYHQRRGEKIQCTYEVRLPKTDAGIRTIPLMNTVLEALQDEYAYQEEEGFNETEIDGMTGFIFKNRFGNIVSPSSVNTVIKGILAAYHIEEMEAAKKEKREPLMIPHFTCHCIRHTFCTRLCEKEMNVKTIQVIMGHKDIQTTLDIYADVTEATKQTAITKLANDLDVF